jgi:hypothetical protein
VAAPLGTFDHLYIGGGNAKDITSRFRPMSRSCPTPMA